MLDPIHLLLDGLPQHRIVDHLKDKQRFRNLSKRLQRPIEGVLLRVRVEPAEQVRSRHLLELDGRDQPCAGWAGNADTVETSKSSDAVNRADSKTGCF